LKRRDIRIVTSLPREPLMVMADKVRLEQVLINLIRNALDATKDAPGPEVRIVATGGESIIVAVRDNGHGITNFERLFEPFYTTKAPGDGVGLGLAISSSIVNDFGGRLVARNGREGGAVFEIILPALGAGRQAAE
jgi:two-component system C4-dicarboxylate transport sensor histidine kinase DctB